MLVFETLLGLVLVGAVVLFFTRKMSSKVHVERTFAAPISKVWNFWSDPEAMKKWWGPNDFTCPMVKNDFRVGGTFLIAMRSSKGETFWNTGTYTEINPHQKIRLLFSFSDETGQVLTGGKIPVPGVWPDAVTMEISFKEVNGKTLVTFIETGLPLVMKFFVRMGWEQQFDKMEALV